LQDVLSLRRRLRGRHRLDARIEERSSQIRQLTLEGLARGERREVRIARLERPVRLRGERSRMELVEGEARKEFLRGRLVVVPAVRPEEQREIADLAERGRRDPRRARHDLLQQPFFAESEARQLVVDDRIDRDRGLREPVGERLMTRVELVETARLELDESGVADALNDRARRGRLLRGEGSGGQAQNDSRAADLHNLAILSRPSASRAAAVVTSRPEGLRYETSPSVTLVAQPFSGLLVISVRSAPSRDTAA